MPGPAPKHPSRRARRNGAKSDFRTLASVPEGAVPVWPLPPDVALAGQLEAERDQVASLQAELAAETDGRKLARMRRQIAAAEIRCSIVEMQLKQAVDCELELWAEMWAMPQAAVWRETHSERAVAQYVRLKIRAEQGSLPASTEARQWADRLGLSPLALFRLRVEIEHAEQAAADGAKRREGPASPAPADPPKPGGSDDPRSGLYAVS